MKMNRTSRLGVIAAISLATMAGTVAMASAQTSSPSTTTSASPTAASPAAGAKLRGMPGRGGFGAHAATVANALGITTTELQTQLSAGKTVAQIATDRGVSLQKVIDAYVAEEVAEHPEMSRADVVTKVTNRLNGVRPEGGAGGPGGPGRGGRGGRGFGSHVNTIASALGITTTELQTQMSAGKSVAQIATDRGVSLQKVIDAYVAEEVAEHPEMSRADVVTRVTNRLNGVRPAGTKGPGAKGSPSTTATTATAASA